MNGFRLSVKPGGDESFLIGKVIQKKIEIDDIAAWLESKMNRVV